MTGVTYDTSAKRWAFTNSATEWYADIISEGGISTPWESVEAFNLWWLESGRAVVWPIDDLREGDVIIYDSNDWRETSDGIGYSKRWDHIALVVEPGALSEWRYGQTGLLCYTG